MLIRKKTRQRNINDINFLVYRTSFYFLDRNPHKKGRFCIDDDRHVMIDFSISRRLYTQERVLHFMREEVTTPREIISLIEHTLNNTQVFDSINIVLCNNVLYNVKIYCNHYIATHCKYKMPSLGVVITFFYQA